MIQLIPDTSSNLARTDCLVQTELSVATQIPELKGDDDDDDDGNEKLEKCWKKYALWMVDCRRLSQEANQAPERFMW
jgi:hypothetical protein